MTDTEKTDEGGARPDSPPSPEERPLDAVTGTWVDDAPAWLRPYLRLARADRPIGAWLLLWPCWWSLALANPRTSFLPYFVLFFIGAFVMRAAGCVFNDIVDRDIDAGVERTRARPLASGRVSLPMAIVFLGLLLLVGLVILVQFNSLTIMLGVASLGLVAIYPFMKRITYWPQAVLGLTFNWGALMGWAAATGSLAPPAIALYIAGFFWTMGYDTIYAHQDKEDDVLMGVKSLALKLGEGSKAWIAAFYGLSIVFLGLAGALANLGPLFYVVLAFAAAHLIYQIIRVDIDDPDTCLEVFRSNRIFGWIVFAAIVFGGFATAFGA
ncbi:MAG: 4-hydroxybenzoate octaprenyltransferase [Alphaproteobacteria bacterium]|nr:MAG: 4-hydroxybenzoate octaprenyltransferase [Alphaproteobacteria bacterium]